MTSSQWCLCSLNKVIEYKVLMNVNWLFRNISRPTCLIFHLKASLAQLFLSNSWSSRLYLSFSSPSVKSPFLSPSLSPLFSGQSFIFYNSLFFQGCAQWPISALDVPAHLFSPSSLLGFSLFYRSSFVCLLLTPPSPPPPNKRQEGKPSYIENSTYFYFLSTETSQSISMYSLET